MKKRVLMLATTAAMIEQFNKNNIILLNSLGYEVDVAGNFLEGNPISDERLDEFKKWIEERNGKWFHIPATRKPMDFKGNGKAIRMIVELIKEYNYDFIHCHTPIGSVIGRVAAHKTNTKIIYTAHGFHFYTGAPKKNWLLYYPVEKFLSRWTDILITINDEDFGRASNKFHAKHVFYIPGVGIDTEKYEHSNPEKEALRIAKRAELGIPKDAFLIASVGELNNNKNHSVIIKAIAKLESSVHYIIVGRGALYEEYANLAKGMNIGAQVHVLGYRVDVADLYAASDLCAFPSIREGLGLAAVEGMASGLPMLVSDNRGTRGFIGKDNGITCKYDDVDGFAEAISTLKNNPEMRKNMGDANILLSKEFDIKVVNQKMEEIYKMM